MSQRHVIKCDRCGKVAEMESKVVIGLVDVIAPKGWASIDIPVKNTDVCDVCIETLEKIRVKAVTHFMNEMKQVNK